MKLQKDYYEKENFTDLEVAKKRTAKTTFIDCTFDRISFNEAKIVDCIFQDCTFNGCGFLLAEVQGIQLKNVTFDGCKLVGITFNRDSINNNILTAFKFNECKLMSCSFYGLNIDKPEFNRCNFSESSFAECRFNLANFSGSQFERTAFTSCNLSYSDFRGATGFAIDPRKNKLAKAHFCPAGALELLANFDIEIG